MAQMALRTKVDRARAYWRALLAVEGWLWTLGALVVALLVTYYLDRTLVLSIEARIGAWAVMGALALGLLGFLVVRPLLRPRSDVDIAVAVERRYPHLRERLLSAVEFARLPDGELRGVSRTLLADLQQDANREAAGLNFHSAFELGGVRRAGLACGLILLLLALHLIFAGPAFTRFLSRMALSNAPVWRDTRVQVSPLRTKILRGSDLMVSAEQEGRRVDRGNLHFRFGDGRWTRAEVRAGASGAFTYQLKQVTEPVAYYLEAGDGKSDRGIAEVVDPAAIVGAKLTLIYPAYMDRAPTTIMAQSGGIAAPVGTQVRLELQANKPIETAEARVHAAVLTADATAKPKQLPPSAPAQPWEVKGDRIFGVVLVRANGHYTLQLKDTDGFLAPEPQSFPIKAIPDQTPEVQLLEPGGDLDVVPNAQIRLGIAAKDDYGVANVRVPYSVGARASGTLPAGVGGKKVKTLELESVWDLSSLHLKPGDVVKYRVEATDYDTITGPHVGRTGDYQLRLISREEAERRYDEQRQEILRQLKELAREQQTLRSMVDSQRASARPNAEQLLEAEQRQRGAAATSADLARRVEELSRMGEMNRLAEASELQSQRSAQENLRRLSEQSIPQAAERLGNAQSQSQSNPSAARGELEQASQQQQQIQQELQRALQELQPVNELQRMADRLDRLAQEQRELRAQTDRLLPELVGRPAEELTPEQRQQLQQNAQRQQQLERATQQATEDLERAAQSLRNRNGEQSDAARDAAQSLRQSGVTEQQQQAAQNTQQNALGQARQQQQQAEQALRDAAQQLRDAASPEDQRSLQRQLQQAQRQLQRLMNQQRDAAEQTRGQLTPQQQRQLAEQQRQLEQQARDLARQLQRLQRRTPSTARAASELQQSAQNSQQAGQSLQQGNQQNAQRQQQQSLQAMQRAMASLQQAMAEAGENQDPFAELRKSLQQLRAQQNAIQQATRRIEQEEQERPGQSMDAAAREELRQLAQRQAEVESQTGRLEGELPGDTFKALSRQARQAMTRSREALDQGNPKANPTQRAQGRAATVLDQLAKALEPEQNDAERGESGGGGQGGGQGEQGDPDLQKRIAEIRLLRLLERSIKDQTQALDDARNPREPLTDDQRAQLDDLAQQQRTAKSLADRLTQDLNRNRSLRDKVQQAGRHMAEAQRRLDQQETGSPVQEQEEQAIVRLSEALRQAQQQQQQSQSNSSQQQASQQQQQQQQNGQPSGGQAQNGTTPALRSTIRRSTSQSGPLSEWAGSDRGFGGLDPRAQDALRQSYKEKAPAEYQDLINRYYRALSSQGNRR